jgi:hypothetical protein
LKVLANVAEMARELPEATIPPREIERSVASVASSGRFAV